VARKKHINSNAMKNI